MFIDKDVASEMFEVFSEVTKKEIVMRMYVEGYSNEKIAKATGLSTKEIKQQVIQIKAGEMLKSFEIASRMIARGGFDSDLIAELTGLQQNAVVELKGEMIKKGELEKDAEEKGLG